MKYYIMFILLCFIPFTGFTKDKKVISILYFDNTTKNKEYKWLCKGLADMLITDVAQSSSVIVVEREQLNKVLSEQKLALTGLVDEKNALKIGELLNADNLITGSFIIQNDTVRIDAKIVDTQTGKITGIKSTGKIASILDIAEELAGNIFSRLVLTAPLQTQTGGASLDAMRYYYEGVDNLDAGDFQNALSNFNQSARIDPLYDRPQKGLEKAYEFLKDFKMRRYQREVNQLYERLAKLKKVLDMKPYKNYANMVTNEGWLKMTPEEREAFNRENEIYISYSTPSLCTLELQNTLMQVADKKESFISEKWDEMESDFNKKKDSIQKDLREENNKQREKEKAFDKEYREKSDEIDKMEDKDLKEKKSDELKGWRNTGRDRLKKEWDELQKKHDDEEKALDQEEDSNSRNKEQDEKSIKDKNFVILKEITRISENSRHEYAKDKFLPNILYMELLALNQLKDYKALKENCEAFLTDYPDYQANWAVEDFYKRSLDELKKQESGAKE